MANIKSSKKAIKVIAKKTEANHDYKVRVKNSIKECEKAIVSKDLDAATEAVKKVQKNIDKAVSKGVIKKNTADREKSRLNKKVKDMK
ncbi:MAG TPA: 30S ribosomal protein S20 [Firmicutes bacterium]|nr:30S ribosomal protein S20 [Bacillota bacterium]